MSKQLDSKNAKNSNELYTLLPTVFYELEENWEEKKLTITEMEDEQIRIALEDNDFGSMDMSKNEAVKMAQAIIKHCM